MVGILKARGSELLCRGSRGLVKWLDRNGLWPKAKAWNCCCCPRTESTTQNCQLLLGTATGSRLNMAMLPWNREIHSECPASLANLTDMATLRRRAQRHTALQQRAIVTISNSPTVLSTVTAAQFQVETFISGHCPIKWHLDVRLFLNTITDICVQAGHMQKRLPPWNREQYFKCPASTRHS